MIGLIGFVAAVLVLSYFVVRGIRYLAERHEILDVSNERSSHTGSMPRGAGLAIFGVTLLAVWLYVGLNPAVERSSLSTFTIGAVLIVSISWLDDLRSQPNWIRFTVHSVAALLTIYGLRHLPVNILSTNHVLPAWLIA